MSHSEIKRLQQSIDAAEKNIAAKKEQLRLLRKANGLQISDHAKLRYLQRVANIDVDGFCSQILTPQLLRLHATLGDGQYPVDEGNTVAIIKGNVITTIITPK
jgi:hypothetical protein